MYKILVVEHEGKGPRMEQEYRCFLCYIIFTLWMELDPDRSLRVDFLNTLMTLLVPDLSLLFSKDTAQSALVTHSFRFVCLATYSSALSEFSSHSYMNTVNCSIIWFGTLSPCTDSEQGCQCHHVWCLAFCRISCCS